MFDRSCHSFTLQGSIIIANRDSLEFTRGHVIKNAIRKRTESEFPLVEISSSSSSSSASIIVSFNNMHLHRIIHVKETSADCQLCRLSIVDGLRTIISYQELRDCQGMDWMISSFLALVSGQDLGNGSLLFFFFFWREVVGFIGRFLEILLTNLHDTLLLLPSYDFLKFLIKQVWKVFMSELMYQ